MKRMKVYIKGKFGGRVTVDAEVLEEHDKTVLVSLPGGDVVTRHLEKHVPAGAREALEKERWERRKEEL